MTTATIFAFVLFLVLKLSCDSVKASDNTTAFTENSGNETVTVPTPKVTTPSSPWPDCYRLNCSCDLTTSGWTVECSGNSITSVPQGLPVNTTRLKFRLTRIEKLGQNSFKNYTKVRILFIDEDSSLSRIEPLVFSHMTELQVLEITNCLSLKTLDEGVLYRFNVLTNLVITGNGLTDLPHMGVFEAHHLLTEIDFSDNKNIKIIRNNSLARVKTYNLRLMRTGIETIENEAFANTDVARLFLSENENLNSIGENAFLGLKQLRFLDLSSTAITVLPTKGLDKLRDLKLKNTPSLRIIPPVVKFLDLKVAEVTYPHHCCAFKNPDKQNPTAWAEYKEEQAKIHRDCASTIATTQSMTTPGGYVVKRHVSGEGGFGSIRSITTQSDDKERGGFQTNNGGFGDSGFGKSDFGDGGFGDDGFGNGGFGNGGFGDGGFGDGGFLPGFPTPDPSQTSLPSGNHVTKNSIFHNETRPINGIVEGINCGELIYRQFEVTNCTPEPNAWNPCEDVLGYIWLRIFIWIVLLAAILGNLAVIIVIISNHNKMTVPKFLMCNLSFADLMMGVYLLFIASIDANTLGEYFNYAVHWQNEGGCQAAGFLTVFASELSIYTLAVITLERWYAISHAIHLNKRLRLHQAAVVMSVGWVFALIMSSLPLSNIISSYSTTSICLPFKFESPVDQGYIIFLIVVNGLAFIAVCACYISMFVQVYGNSSNAPGSDATIAKRMAILVFTDFACYAPIAFFALTAAGGLVLINITNSKVLLVFFYPLNSCANPFLYAIFTKQFRKDLFMMLSRYGICQKRAAKYKGTYVSGGASITQSRNSMPLHHIRNHPSDGSILTQYTEFPANRGSRPSIQNSPHVTPQNTPKQTQRCVNISPRNSPRMNGVYREHSPGGGSGHSSNGTPPRKKLSVVPETIPRKDSNQKEPCVEPADTDIEHSMFERADSLGDDEIFDGVKSENQAATERVRSASQYEVANNTVYNTGNKKQDRLVSQTTDISSTTQSSFLSDDVDDEHGRHLTNSVINENEVLESHVDDPSNTLPRRSIDRESGFHSSPTTPDALTTNNNEKECKQYINKFSNRKKSDDVKQASREEFVEML